MIKINCSNLEDIALQYLNTLKIRNFRKKAPSSPIILNILMR